MGVAEKGGNALRKLKSAAQKRASSLPAGNLINAVVDQVNQFETGIKQTVDGVQDKVKGLQAIFAHVEILTVPLMVEMVI